MLRYAADFRTLLWMLVFAPGLVAIQFARPDLLPYLSWVSFYFAISAAVIAHNHQHVPTFHNKVLNEIFGTIIAIFYGFPTFAWIPTHNLNHHKYVNKPGDATITWRFTNKHNLLVASTYFFVSAYYQSIPTKEFLDRVRRKDPAQFRRYMLQYLFVYGTHVALAALAVWLHGWKLGLTVYAFTLMLPSIVSLWTVHTYNYDQHVHTDPWSKYNHSRNFESFGVSFFLFNNGFHTAHHENASVHWSELPKLHAELRPHIHPELLQNGLLWYWTRCYLLAPFFPKMGTQQIGRAPFDTGDDQVDITTAEVGYGDSGTNAARI
ncbi:MAG TPA: fatty acid desaturase [Polyangiaceae bacterium]|nr:fatty acid desaturase [Polyangiaceae bacterium]